MNDKPTKQEIMLLEAMKSIGLNPEIHYRISIMTFDFAFPEQKLIVEVDGGYHRTPEEIERSEKRRDIAENLGWRVKIFTNEQVEENPLKVALRIKQLLNPPSQEEMEEKVKKLRRKLGMSVDNSSITDTRSNRS